MGFVTTAADADGSVHTAAMHNTPLQTHEATLNGGIDHDNLEYPRSVVTHRFSNMLGEDDGVAEYPYVGMWKTTEAAGAPYDQAAAGSNYFYESVKFFSREHRILSAYLLYRPSNIYTTLELFTVVLEKSTVLTGGWSTIASLTFDAYQAASPFSLKKATFTVTSSTLAINDYLRCKVTNPAVYTSPEYPPVMIGEIEFAVIHVQ